LFSTIFFSKKKKIICGNDGVYKRDKFSNIPWIELLRSSI
jgi:hypothetical protein